MVFTGQRTDPYGFWTIKGKDGKDKIDFDAQYTSVDDALKAVKQRLNELGVPATGL